MSLHPSDESRVIEMAWEDRTPFEAIGAQFGLSESEVINLMRTRLKRRSFKLWRAANATKATKATADANKLFSTHCFVVELSITKRLTETSVCTLANFLHHGFARSLMRQPSISLFVNAKTIFSRYRFGK